MVKCSIYTRSSVVYSDESANAINNNINNDAGAAMVEANLEETSGTDSTTTSASNSVENSINNLTLYLANSSGSASPDCMSSRSPDIRRSRSVDSRSSDSRIHSPLSVCLDRTQRSLSRSPDCRHRLLPPGGHHPPSGAAISQNSTPGGATASADTQVKEIGGATAFPETVNQVAGVATSPDVKPKRPVSMVTEKADGVNSDSPEPRPKRPISTGNEYAEFVLSGCPEIRIKRFAKFPRSRRHRSDHEHSGSPDLHSSRRSRYSTGAEACASTTNNHCKPINESSASDNACGSDSATRRLEPSTSRTDSPARAYKTCKSKTKTSDNDDPDTSSKSRHDSAAAEADRSNKSRPSSTVEEIKSKQSKASNTKTSDTVTSQENTSVRPANSGTPSRMSTTGDCHQNGTDNAVTQSGKSLNNNHQDDPGEGTSSGPSRLFWRKPKKKST